MQIKNTLTRWHKIVERLQARMAQIDFKIAEFVGTHVVSVEDAEAELAKGAEDFSKAKALVVEGQNVSRTIREIRSALAKANANGGVSDLLAEIEETKRNIGLMTRFAMCQENTDIQKAMSIIAKKKSDIAKYEERIGTDAGILAFITRAKGEHITFSAVSAAEQEKAAEDVEAMRRRIIIATDKLAELNAAVITLDIDDAVAKTVGLV